jgi:uncharacterized protein (DUF1499 family)
MVKERKVGMTNGKFFPCHEKQTCVSTHADESDELHYIKPIHYQSSKEEAMNKIVNILNSLKRTKLIEKQDDYMRYEFITLLLRFKDDVEFYFDDDSKIIHFRSQSRIGGYDWGTNRKRMEKIRRLYMN